MLKGTGLLTSPIIVQDLAIWLPLLATAALACWRRQTWGVLVTGAMLTMYVLECIGIAADQWLGANADPSIPAVASMSMVPVFVALTAATVVPLVWYLRNIGRSDVELSR